MRRSTTFNKGAGALTRALRERTTRERRAREAEHDAQSRGSAIGFRNDLRPSLALTDIAIDRLLLPAHDARTHERAHVEEIATSIRNSGFVDPVAVTASLEVVNGVSRVLAAKACGLICVPCVVLDHLSPDQSKALRLSLNRLQEKGGWDLGELRVIVDELVSIDEPIVGFDDAELDIVLEAEADAEEVEDDPAPIDAMATPVSQVGDLWRLGDDRVLCADARDPRALERLMDNHLAAFAITDPPYNVPIKGHVTGGRHREFVQASGELSPRQFAVFLEDFLANLVPGLKDGALVAVFMDWRHIAALLGAASEVGLSLINFVVWSKSNAAMGSLWRSAHELLPIFKSGAAPHVNQVRLGKSGRWRKNVWEYPGASSLGSDARDGLADHPTVKPVKMIEDAILDVTRRGDIVLDPFLGSGTTLIAALRAGRRCFGMELDPLYVDLILRRWTARTGLEPVLDDTDEPFEAVRARRSMPNRLLPSPDKVFDLTKERSDD